MALLAFYKSTTTEQAAYCVNLILISKLAMESFSLEKNNYVAFHLLDKKIKWEFATTVKNRIFEFLQQVKTNTTGIKVLFPQVIVLS